jgi:hypothetical protein
LIRNANNSSAKLINMRYEKEKKTNRLRVNLLEFYQYCTDLNVARSSVEVTILWVVFACEMLLYVFNEVYKSGLLITGQSTTIDIIYSFSKFIQMEGLETISPTLYTVIATIIKILVIVNFAVFPIFVFDIFKALRFQKVQSMFCHFNFYSVFVLTPITAEVLLKEIHSHIFVEVNNLSLVLNIIVFCVLVFDLTKFALLMQFEYFTEENWLTSLDNLFYVKMIALNILTLFLIFIGLRVPIEAIKITSMTSLLVVGFLVYLYMLTRQTFESIYTQRLVTIIAANIFSLLLSLSLLSVLPSLNFIYVLVITTIASIAMELSKKRDSFPTDPNEIPKQFEQMINHSNHFFRLINSFEANSEVSILINGRLNSHAKSCSRTTCFCSEFSIHEQTDAGSIMEYNIEAIPTMAGRLIRDLLENSALADDNDNARKYLLALFYYKKLNNRVLAINIIRNIEISSLKFSEDMKFHRLLKLIQRDQEDFNRETFKAKRIEELVRYDEVISLFTRVLSNLLTNLNIFWRYMLFRDEISYDEFKEQTTRILEIKFECKSVLKVLESFSVHSPKLRFLNSFIQRELLNKKINEKLEDLYLAFEEIEQNSFSEDMTILNANFYSMFLQNYSCVLELGVEPHNIGIVQKASETVVSVFGHEKADVIGHSINRLMPEAVGFKHNDILQDLLLKGNSHMSENSLVSFGIHKESGPMEVKVKYKVDFTSRADILLVGLISKIESVSQPKKYIVTDDLGFISSISQKLSDCLSISEEDICHKRINIGMISRYFIEMLPVHNLIQFEVNEPTGNLLYKKMNVIDKKSNLIFPVGKEQLNEEIALFSAIKTVTGEMMQEAMTRGKILKYESATNSFKMAKGSRTTDQQSVMRIKTLVQNFSELPLDYVQLEKMKSEDPFEMFFAHRNSIFTQLENPSVVKLSKFHTVGVNFDLAPKRHPRIPNFNVFVINNIEITNEPRTTLRIENVRESAYIGFPTHLGENNGAFSNRNSWKTEVSPYAKASFDSDQSSEVTGILPFIKKSANPFIKGETEETFKKYWLITVLDTFAICCIIYLLSCEVLFLNVSKIPLMKTQKSLIDDFYDVQSYQVAFIDTYSSLISGGRANISFNATSRVLSKIEEMTSLHIKRSVLKFTLNKDLNDEFVNIFQPGYEVTMNNSFLIQNYISELKKYANGRLKLADVTSRNHRFMMVKFKARLLNFFRTVESIFKEEFQFNKDTLEYRYTLVYFSWNGVLFIMMMVIDVIVVILLRKLLIINTAILFTDDNSTIGIIQYYSQIENFLDEHFDGVKSSHPPAVLPKSTNNLMIRETPRVWKGLRKRMKETIAIVIFLVLMLDLCLVGGSLVRYFFEASLYGSSLSSQDIGRAILEDFKGVSLIVMLAKDHFLLPESSPVVNATIISEVAAILERQREAEFQGSSIEDLMRPFYTQNVCDFVEQSKPYCKEVYSSILQNNIRNIKLILKSKLGFVFTGTSPSAYNYTAADAQSLDAVKVVLDDAFAQIFSVWNIEFSNSYGNSILALVILTAGYCCVVISVYLGFSHTVIKRLDRFYTHERKVFKNFMPLATLRKSKLARVRLKNDYVLKHS